MLEANWAPLIASKYCFSSGVQADGPATLDVGIGSVESLLPEQADSTKVRLAINAIERTPVFFESIFNTS
jgi:hypothetical protein